MVHAVSLRLVRAFSTSVFTTPVVSFIGNRAITIGNGDEAIQLVYNAGFTVLSV